MQFVKDLFNFLSSPAIFFTLVIVLFFVALRTRRLWTDRVGTVALVAVVVYFVVSFFDPNFKKVVTAPDNVPIVGMLFLIGFFAWFSLKQAYENDDRMARGEPPAEKLETDEKVWCWPDLVYTELIALLVASIVLLVWAILIEAPLEEPASITVAPNPSKAPWYFLGLQEMLVYFDPWLAGVVFPSLIILGLMALPYIDTNPKGNGYYTFRERAREIALFLFGFLVLWVFMIMTGTFLRGPNWNFFGPYEYWDPHKLVPLNNINFSEFIWVRWLGTGLPQQWLAREIFGILVVLAYFLALPPLLARRWLNDIHRKMGAARYAVGIVLILSMIALPIKMYLRWIFNLKYIIAIPEFFFNI